MNKVLVVGQGLAGTAVIRCLQERNIDFKVISTYQANSSSMVAAGLYNPITFKRLKATWMAKELFKQLESQYTFNGEEFYTSRSLVKILSNVEEENRWIEQANSPQCEAFLDDQILASSNSKINAPLGVGQVKKAGNLNASAYINAVKKDLKLNGKVDIKPFEYRALEIKEGKHVYNEQIYDHIIFCEGYHTKENPWFGWLPIQLMKGELLTIESKDLNLEQVINAGFFILPLSQERYHVGATYDPNDTSTAITEKAKETLLAKFTTLCTAEFKVVDHKAGIRPAVIDRRPIVGQHPEYKNMWVLNGLGSKGVMLSHYFAKELIEHIFEGFPINKEASIERFYKKYYEKD